jgi:hypothetical protein
VRGSTRASMVLPLTFMETCDFAIGRCSYDFSLRVIFF